MRHIAVIALLGVVSIGRAEDLAKLPANIWVEIKYSTIQPSDHPEEKGQWCPVG